MARWLLAAALTLVLAVAAGAGPPAPRSLTVLSDTPLSGPSGTSAGRAAAFSAWDVLGQGPGYYLAARFGPTGEPLAGRLLERRERRGGDMWLFAPQGRPGPWWVPAAALLTPAEPAPGQAATVGVLALGRAPRSAAVLLPGPASRHAQRLARLSKANLPPETKARLAAGRIQKGDGFWKVEMAWGRPQRSFMVNYLSDEQHYVYLLPSGPVLLRFQGGRLTKTPPQMVPAPAKVANPPTQR
ncbi:MAG: hypothetical protein K9K66_02340 [Desulfarculaceae bacterium]|nr:hypothetical protein [Desulfarculaceae bacterium]MCF8070887.1 hypothetical protein [Desulfarculaceae bacterium]MCF8100475.1 hypothetical protein [Desulfarculaceae bacterium]